MVSVTVPRALQQHSPGSRSVPGVRWWIIDERRRCSTNVAVVKPFQGLGWLSQKTTCGALRDHRLCC